MKWKNKGHEFDAIAKKFDGVDKIYIYGCGRIGTMLANVLSSCNTVAGFIDINYADFPFGYMGKPVYAPHDFLKIDRNNIIVIIAIKEDIFARRTFIFEGFVEGLNLFDHTSFYHIYLPIYYLYRFGKLFVPYRSLGVRLTRECSLNCKHCADLTHYYECDGHGHLEYNEAIRRIDFLFGKFDYMTSFYLCGGETFLYPRLREVIEYALTKYGDRFCELEMYTNGFFPSLDEKFMQILRSDKIKIYWSDYLNQLKDEHIKQKTIENIDAFKRSGININRSDFMWYVFAHGEKRKETTECELETVYNNCNRNYEIYDNMLLGCSVSRSIAKYKMGLNEATEGDYVNLEEENNKAVILEMLLGYTETGHAMMCSHCSGNGAINKRNRVCPGEQI